MSPPGLAPVASPRRSHLGKRKSPVNAARFAELVQAVLGRPEAANLSVMQAQHAVRQFLATGLDETALVSWVIAYADPTGETAVRNVMRQR